MRSLREGQVRGEVIETLPNLEYRVQLEDGRVIRCYCAGKLKLNRVHILIGDTVDCVYPPQSSVGRIVFRYSTKNH